MAIARRAKGKSAINASAMSDIAFLLLIFFMLSSVSEEDKEIPIELPQSVISLPENEKFFNVWVDKDGDIYFGAKKGSPEKLTTFTQYKLRSNPEVRVLIRASKDVRFETINSIFDALKDAGAHYIVLVSEKK